MTFLVNDLAAYADYLPTIGATLVRAIQQVPNGRNMLVQHPARAELAARQCHHDWQHRPQQPFLHLPLTGSGDWAQRSVENSADFRAVRR